MATIYKFQDSEANITSSATSTGASGATLVATDAMLVFNTGPNKTNQTTVGSIAGLGKTEFISTNTSSSLTSFPTLSPYGNSVLASPTTGLVCVLPAPPQAGLFKTILLGTSTTTAIQVVCPTTVSAILTTGASSNVFVANESAFFGQQGAFLDLVSISTAAWLTIGRVVSATALAFTTTTTT